MKLTKLIFVPAILLMVCSCSNSVQTLQEGKKPKNVILLIGDGMGLAQVSTTFYYQKKKPSFTRFNNIGLINTSSSAEKVTDSASSATAYATGKRTYNGAIAVNPDTAAIPTIVELLSPKGFSTGVIATSSIVHATPASFYAHSPRRSYYEYIASQLGSSDVDFFAGGGYQFFAKRDDKKNYLDSLKSQGFTVETNSIDGINSFDINKKYGFLLADDGMPRMLDGRGDFLLKATKKAIAHLKQDEDGFFLMVEGSQIDWGGHANDADYVITETKDFDTVIEEVLDFAEKDGNTLVIVTADHETGGFSLSAAEVRRQADYANIMPTFSTGNHSATLVPVFAYGPGSEVFRGIYENKDIFDKMLLALGK